MQKQILTAIIVFIAANVFIYALFAFTLWEANPSHWSFQARGFFATLSFFVGLLFAIYVPLMLPQPQ